MHKGIGHLWAPEDAPTVVRETTFGLMHPRGSRPAINHGFENRVGQVRWEGEEGLSYAIYGEGD